MARKRTLPVTVVAAALAAWACLYPVAAATRAADNKPVYQQQKPIYEQQKNIIYSEVDGVALVMDVFKPAGSKNGVGIIDVASGAWHSDRGKIEDHRRARMFDIFCGRGYTVFAIRPGSISKYSAPEMIKNLRAGIAWVRNHAAEFGIDPNRMGLSGASAGAHLACLEVVTAAVGKDGTIDQPFQAVGLFFPPTDFLSWGGYAINFAKNDPFGRLVRSLALTRGEQIEGKLEGDQLTARIRSICPARLIQGKLPPFLVFHGDADPMVPLQQSQVLVDAIKKSGNSAELIIKPGGKHPWPTIPEEIGLMADWFDKQLKPKPAS